MPAYKETTGTLYRQL